MAPMQKELDTKKEQLKEPDEIDLIIEAQAGLTPPDPAAAQMLKTLSTNDKASIGGVS